MSTNAQNPFTKTKPSRWGHPLVFVASAIGLLGSSAVYYAQIRARQRARSRLSDSSVNRIDFFALQII